MTGLIGLMAFATPSAAQKVATFAQNGSEGNSVASTYNYTTEDNFVYFRAPVGAKRFGGCNSGATCSAGQTGTMGASPNANASFSGTTLSDVDAGGPAAGSAFARADLTTGQLGVSVAGDYRIRFGDSGDGIGGHATASFADGLNFQVAGANAGTLTNIGITVDLHGAFTDDGHGNLFSNTNLINTLQFGDASYRTDDGLGITANTHQASGWSSYSFSPDLPGHIVFSGIYTLRGASQSLGIFEQLITSSGYGASSDFAHTSTFSFTLPETVNFTSDSGAFLTSAAPAGGVPEPGTWSLMLLGFGGLGAILRTRRRAGGSGHLPMPGQGRR